MVLYLSGTSEARAGIVGDVLVEATSRQVIELQAGRPQDPDGLPAATIPDPQLLVPTRDVTEEKGRESAEGLRRAMPRGSPGRAQFRLRSAVE